jgi:disulfide bond formation protein DsbB
VDIEWFNTIAALAAFMAIGIGVVALVGAFVPSTRAALAPLSQNALRVGFLVAVASTAGSLYYSEVEGFIPCDYCWYQRIAMYPLTIVFGVALVRRDRLAAWTALPLATIGLGISIYHYQLQVFPDQGNSCGLTAPCTVRWVETFGFMSIPFMAGCGFLAIVGLSALILRGDGSTPVETSDDELVSAAS